MPNNETRGPHLRCQPLIAVHGNIELLHVIFEDLPGHVRLENPHGSVLAVHGGISPIGLDGHEAVPASFIHHRSRNARESCR